MPKQKTFINPFSGKPIQHPEPDGGGYSIKAFKREVFISTDGMTDIILSEAPILNSENVYRNGQILFPGASNDYQISGSDITLNPDVAATVSAGETFTVNYAV